MWDLFDSLNYFQLLMVPREFDLARDSVSQLRRLTMPQRRVDSRNVRSDMFNINCNRNLEEDIEAEMRPIVMNFCFLNFILR